MAHTRSPIRSAIAVAGTAIATVMPVAAAPTSHAETMFGAYYGSPAGAWAVYAGAKNFGEAQREAQYACLKLDGTCELLVVFADPPCAAINLSGTKWFTGKAATKQEAETLAIKAADGRRGYVTSACSSDAGLQTGHR